MKTISIELPDDLHARLKIQSTKTGRAMKKEAVNILQQFLSETREIDVTIEELRLLEEMRAESKRRAE